jgi:type I restriction enzyme S subunit
LQKGDVLITKDSETPDDIGIPAVVVDDLPNTICGYHLALIRPKPCVDPAFLAYVFESDIAKRHFLRTANGVTRFGIGMGAISSLVLPFPPTAEQVKIAHVLRAVDATIECSSAAIHLAHTLKRAILQNFFFHALGETAYADRPRGELPPGWSLAPTELLLAGEPKNGVSPEAFAHPPGTPTFSIAAIRDGRVNLTNEANLKYTRVSEVVAARFRVQRGDVLIVRGNANPDLVGKAGMVKEFPNGCIYPDIAKRVLFRTDGKPSIRPEFAVLAWNHPVVHNQVLRRAKTSNGTLKINNRDVRQIIMPVPPEIEQAQLVKVIAGVDAQVDALTAARVAQQQLKLALMHDLLSGPQSLTADLESGVA